MITKGDLRTIKDAGIQTALKEVFDRCASAGNHLFGYLPHQANGEFFLVRKAETVLEHLQLAQAQLAEAIRIFEDCIPPELGEAGNFSSDEKKFSS